MTDQEHPCRAEGKQTSQIKHYNDLLLKGGIQQWRLQVIIGLQTLQTQIKICLKMSYWKCKGPCQSCKVSLKIKPILLSIKPHNHAAHMQHLPNLPSDFRDYFGLRCVTATVPHRCLKNLETTNLTILKWDSQYKLSWKAQSTPA